MRFRAALDKLKEIAAPGESVAISYSVSACEGKEYPRIAMHQGDLCVLVQSYEAGFIELAKAAGSVADQEPEGRDDGSQAG